MSLGEIVVTLVELIIDVIETIIKITLPIGWNELGVIATVIAVIVALAANKKASEQLKSALEMQEQSKNVGLLDRRIELAETIQSGKFVSELTLQILFNDKILKHYKAWKKYLSEKDSAEHDMGLFFLSGRVEDGESGYINSVRDTIHKYESDMSRPNCPPEIITEYETYCNEHPIWIKTGENLELTPFNHSEISERIATAEKAAKAEQDLTLQLIKKYTSDSIRPLNTKQEKTRHKWKFWKKENQNDSD